MSYSVTASVFSAGSTYSWTINQGDDVPGNVAPAYGLADPLTITQQLAANDRLPQSHPLPDECSFQLIAPDATTYANLALGDPVAVKLYAQANLTGNLVAFYGRIATLSSRPHDLGVIYSVGCVDYLADLAEIQVGGTVAWPAEYTRDRVSRIMAEAQVSWYNGSPAWQAITGFPNLANSGDKMAARNPGTIDVLSAVIDTLDSSTVQSFLDENAASFLSVPGAYPVQARDVLHPVITADRLDPDVPFAIDSGAPITKRVRYVPPGRLVLNGGVYKVTVDAANDSSATGAPILDAGNVDIGSTFSQVKSPVMARRVTVSRADGTSKTWDWDIAYTSDPVTAVQVGLGSPPNTRGIVTAQISTILETTPGMGFDVGAQLYDWRVPFPPDPKASWFAPTLTWHAWHVTNWRRPQLTELVAIARANVTKTPPNREWLVGQLVGSTVTVANGRPTIDLQLVPSTIDFNLQALLQGATNGVCRLDSPVLTSRTLAQLSPRDTFTDYQIVRGS